jgi:hypothetical protein
VLAYHRDDIGQFLDSETQLFEFIELPLVNSGLPILLSLPCLVARPVQAAAESSFRVRSEEPGIL